ncbi:MAG: type III secretion system gatekeeper subunit SctW [Victivallales bacterium]|nr:type III secretion system gatekeeper subunit SctW [Victivallales bacterium]
MPLDMAQFLRNSISVDRYESVRASSMEEAGKTLATEEKGVLMGTGFVVENDPIAELMDSMEELSFQFEEQEMKDVGERKLGETRGKDNPYIRALENWLKTLPDMPGEQFTRSLLAMLRQAKSSGQLPTPRELLQNLAEGSEDPSHQFAMLDILEQALTDGENDFRSLINAARKELVSQKGAEIRAGINLASEVNARATSPEEMQELRDIYRGEVLGFTTPQQCFRSIMGSRGAAGLQQTIDFLTTGCGVDLQSATPSKSPEELRRIMLDLQCVQVLKTVLDRMEGLEGRMGTQFGEHCQMNGEQMTGKIMDFTEFSFVNVEDIRSFISDCGIEKLLARMDFCRELTEVFRQLSSRLFGNEQDRIRLIDTAQEHLDGIIAEEYDEEEEEDDGKEGRR